MEKIQQNDFVAYREAFIYFLPHFLKDIEILCHSCKNASAAQIIVKNQLQILANQNYSYSSCMKVFQILRNIKQNYSNKRINDYQNSVKLSDEKSELDQMNLKNINDFARHNDNFKILDPIENSISTDSDYFLINELMQLIRILGIIAEKNVLGNKEKNIKAV